LSHKEEDILKIQSGIRDAVKHPVCLFLCAAIILFAVITRPAGLFVGDPLWIAAAIYIGALVIFLGWSYWILPAFIGIALRRGNPVVLMHILTYLPLAAVSALLIPLVAPQNSMTTVLIASVSLIIMSCILGLLLFQTLVLPRIGVPITPADIWIGRTRVSEATDCRPPKFKNQIVDRMRADNQYTHVYSKGTAELLRIPLSDAAAQIGLNEGLQVHRSHWVGLHMMSDLKYKSGNPRLILVDGSEIPASRQKVPEIKAALAKKSMTG